MGKLEQGWVKLDGDGDPYRSALTVDASTTCVENTRLRIGSSGRTRTYNPSVNRRGNVVALLLQTQGLQAQFSKFAENWGRFGGTTFVSVWPTHVEEKSDAAQDEL